MVSTVAAVLLARDELRAWHDYAGVALLDSVEQLSHLVAQCHVASMGYPCSLGPNAPVACWTITYYQYLMHAPT